MVKKENKQTEDKN